MGVEVSKRRHGRSVRPRAMAVFGALELRALPALANWGTLSPRPPGIYRFVLAPARFSSRGAGGDQIVFVALKPLLQPPGAACAGLLVLLARCLLLLTTNCLLLLTRLSPFARTATALFARLPDEAPGLKVQRSWLARSRSRSPNVLTPVSKSFTRMRSSLPWARMSSRSTGIPPMP